jgi:ribonuclease HI
MLIEVFIDGASRDKGSGDRRSACAVVIYNKKKEIARFSRLLGDRDHNQAEYEALTTALTMLMMSEYKNPVIYSDSAVVVNQVNGKWAVKSEKLYPYWLTILEIQKEYGFKLVQVKRDKVFIPDDLCNNMLDFLQEEFDKKK